MKKALLWTGAGVFLALVAGAVALHNFDWNRAKPWLNARVSDAIGRPFAIEGDVSIAWRNPLHPEPGWRGWVPWPQLSAQDIRVGNPEGYKAESGMAAVGRASFSLNPLLLLQKRFVVSTLLLEDPQLVLERRLDGSNNWTFKQAGEEGWRLDLGALVLRKGSVRVLDAIRHVDVTVNVDSLAKSSTEGYGVGWKAAGTFNKEPVGGSGRAGEVLSLQSQAEPYPIEADVHVGKTIIKAKGTLTRPSDLTALDMRLSLSGASMGHLFPLFGVLLPETPPYSTEGHLSKLGAVWRYEKFSGKVGSSDLAGTLEFTSAQPRSRLTGEMTSNLLKFSDLAPVVGADSSGSKANRGEADVQPADKILPHQAFKTEQWRSVDADVKFTGHRIDRDKALPVDNLVTRFQLQDGVLSLAPLQFGVAGGTLSSTVRLDGRGKAIKADIKTSARGLKLNELFPAVDAMGGSLGAVNGDATLSGTGNSIALMLGSSSGEIGAAVSQGTVSKLLLDRIGMNIGNVMLARWLGDKDIKVNCAAGDFAVKNGVMQARSVVVDTDQSVLRVDGQIDLARERLDLTIKPANKSLHLISLTGPLYVTGPFTSPAVNADKRMIALKAAGVVALAVLAPVATALIPVTTLGRDKAGNCGKPL